MKSNSEYSIPYTGKPSRHIILSGNIMGNSLTKFLKEFYHPDHDMKEEMKVVIIQN